MIDCNMNVIHEWAEIGGVLGYTIKRNGNVLLYIMDDGEFIDRCAENINITVDDLAYMLCESALRNAGICEEEIGLLMDWDADRMAEICLV